MSDQSHKASAAACWARRADAVLPGKNSNIRRGAQGLPLFFARSEGARYWDVDGNDYIDYVAGMGSAIWGHSNPEYLEAIRAQVDQLFSIGSTVAQTTLEVELAERIVEHVPCAEWVRFGISGSEANQLAIRVARAYSGKPYVLRFEAHYHGWLDSVCGGGAPKDQDAEPHPQPVASDTGGLGPGSQSGSLMIPWNDANALERVLEGYADTIALVLMEPVMLNFGCCPPRPGYLERVRTLCDRYDVLLCFDEVFTGFRVALGGAQELYGVTPDLAVLAKALAGGLPLAALVGRKEILQVLRDDTVLAGGTFNSFPLAVAAGVKNLDMLARDDGAVYGRIASWQAQLMDGIKEIANRHGHPMLVQGPCGVFHFNFIDLDVAYTPSDLTSADWSKLEPFNRLLLAKRVIVGGGSRFVVTDGLVQRDVDDTLSRVEQAMRRL